MDEYASNPRFDRFWLRIGLFAAALTAIAGNLATASVLRGSASGRWIIFGSLVAGLALTLAYEMDVLLRRLRLTLSAWALLFFAQAATMALVSSSFGWQSEAQERGAGTPLSLNMLLLAAAALGLLMRAGIMALCSARWFPQMLVRVVPSNRRTTENPLLMRDELAVPRWWVFVIYFASPVAWWMLLSLSFQSLLVAQSSIWRPLGIFFSLVLLVVRLGLGAWVTFCAWQDSRGMGGWPLANTREARWFAFFSGLPLAGLLSFYAFFFAASRVQYDAMTGVALKEEASATAELRTMMPPLDENDAARMDNPDAVLWLPVAETSYTPAENNRVFRDAWALPSGVTFLRRNAKSIGALTMASNAAECRLLPNPIVDIDTYLQAQPNPESMKKLTQALMLHARFAARDANYAVFHEDLASGLRIAKHLRNQPFLEGCLAENLQIQAITMSALPALLFDPNGAPTDEVLAKTQELFRMYAADRGQPLAQALEVKRLESTRWFAQSLARSGSLWPGDADLASIAVLQPAFVWTIHDAESRWLRDLTAAARSSNMPISLHSLESTGSLRRYVSSFGMLIEDAWKEQDTLCHLRLAEAALAVFRYQRAHGYPPGVLTDCIPDFLDELPEDPYRPRQEVCYDRDPLRVYCAGHDGILQEGTHETEFENFNDFAMSVSGSSGRGNRVLYLDPPRLQRNQLRNYYRVGAVLVGNERMLLASADPLARKAAFQKLYDAGPRAFAALKEIVARVNDPDPEIRMWVACVLGEIGPAGDEQAEALEKLAADPDQDVARFASEAQQLLREAKSSGK